MINSQRSLEEKAKDENSHNHHHHHQIDKKNKKKKIILKPKEYRNTDLSIKPEKIGKDELAKIVDLVNKVKDQVDLVYIDPSEVESIDKKEEKGLAFKNKIIFSSKNADYVLVIEGAENLSGAETPTALSSSSESVVADDSTHLNSKYGVYKKVKSNEDINQIKDYLISNKLDFVIIDLDDWRIIPLENIIASLQSTDIEIFAVAKSIDEVETLFTILELGVDGVVISVQDADEIDRVSKIINKSRFEIKPAVIEEIIDVGMGERVCIDTVSMLTQGEGMLVGNKSNFLFLVHNESIGSSFTSPRPFRVNAGAVHCYTIIPGGTTNYLSELEAGSQVYIVNDKGIARVVGVGRAKIESRPLRLFKAKINDNEFGSIIVQNAETIRFLQKDGDILPVTHAKKGDSVLVYSKPPTGRHFGMEVSNEYILEK
ncbi:3-dehydroquinate synthase II [Candidatus Nitrosocosmicus franklandus]|uniref:3-dehydroquinate synthase n=1 Tax=Candidatus Nitrosocosmicus franklandianus TaxID=1798806 RepID=A0A484I5H9_9ARCH|nr:3-dehydroquinate synthase II [Candidatus Nitrosocosmicus franklandus]VFJ12448.1 3-dehydroquinate synthase [Candidatus Nitrosocosmicus franklandus]